MEYDNSTKELSTRQQEILLFAKYTKICSSIRDLQKNIRLWKDFIDIHEDIYKKIYKLEILLDDLYGDIDVEKTVIFTEND